jgi:hypothetical protein
VELGYSLSSEEPRPADLVRYAREAEESGFVEPGVKAVGDE